MATLERAIEIAVTAHKGQRDKAGGAYVLHPLRVMFSVNSTIEMIVAILHDVVEDTSWTADELRAEGFGDEVLAALDGVTCRDGETYDDFIERAAANPISRAVKLADLEDNMDLRRLAEVGEKDQKRLAKYVRAWRRLKSLDSNEHTA